MKCSFVTKEPWTTRIQPWPGAEWISSRLQRWIKILAATSLKMTKKQKCDTMPDNTAQGQISTGNKMGRYTLLMSQLR